MPVLTSLKDCKKDKTMVNVFDKPQKWQCIWNYEIFPFMNKNRWITLNLIQRSDIFHFKRFVCSIRTPFSIKGVNKTAQHRDARKECTKYFVVFMQRCLMIYAYDYHRMNYVRQNDSYKKTFFFRCRSA